MNDVHELGIEEESRVGEAKRRAAALCRKLDLDETTSGRVAIVVTELATNQLKHAGGGRLLIRSVAWPAGSGVEVLALDTGPGIRDINGSMRDGYSTAGSPGNGLGAVRRLSTVFDIYAPAGSGAAVFSRIWGRTPPRSLPRRLLTVGAVSTPQGGEDVCGDAWAVDQSADRAAVLVVDGLGHGPDAHAAALRAVAAFRKSPDLPPAEQIATLDAALRGSRGAAASAAGIMPSLGVVHYAGLGNIAARIHGGETARTLVGSDGTVGTQSRTARQTTYPWPGDAMMIVHSDGLSARWSLGDYPALHRRHPVLIAGVLYRDHRRERDDATVVVAVPRRNEP